MIKSDHNHDGNINERTTKFICKKSNKSVKEAVQDRFEDFIKRERVKKTHERSIGVER